MIKKGIILHQMAHFILPILIFLTVLYITPWIDSEKSFIMILIGAFMPDIDHIILWRKRKDVFKTFKEFAKRSIVGARHRYKKPLLIFHNFLTILIVTVCVAIFSMINVYIELLFLAFFAHLILDFFTDLFMIKSHTHWKFKK
jgi:hypothetical protein